MENSQGIRTTDQVLVPSSQGQDAICPFMGVLVKVTVELALLDGPENVALKVPEILTYPNQQLQYGCVKLEYVAVKLHSSREHDEKLSKLCSTCFNQNPV